MKGKPRIAIVGAGNLGSALAASLRGAGYPIDAVVVHSRGSLVRGRRLAKSLSARPVWSLRHVSADIVWFCVPDAGIGRAARESAGEFQWRGKTAVHSSGALTSDELGALRNAGASVASVHPLMTFVRGSAPALAGVPFAIEGDASAVRVAGKLVRDLGGRAYSIRKAEKAAYHAWGTFASPLLTALLAATEQVAGAAGVSRKSAARRMLPILQQTLENYAKFGAAAGFSGPIIRGDVETVRRHLRVLEKVPAASEVYRALAEAALEYLPAKNKAALKRLLASSRS